MTEDYVSFETAKLLKEKGFNVPSFKPNEWIFCMYDEEGKLQWGSYSDGWCCRVTLQMAMKWLREKHNIHIELKVLKPYGIDEHRHAIPKEDVIYHAEIFCTNEWNKYLEEFKHVGISRNGTHEEACEAAIKYCLENLI